MKVAAIIPARYGSTRFPGKPLVDILGKSMIRRVVEQVKNCPDIAEVCVATEDDRIASHVAEFGGKVIMTGLHHRSGTDRCYEAYMKTGMQADVVLNVQGDEPFIDPGQLQELIAVFSNSEAQIGTLVKKITHVPDLFNPNKVKVVVDKDLRALYFSRAAIPYLRDADPEKWLGQHVYYKHIGIYGFRPSALAEVIRLPVSSLEQGEGLEQLRWLENGFAVHTAVTEKESLAVDTPQDIEVLLKSRQE